DPLRSAAPPGTRPCRRPRGRGKRAPEQQARGYHPDIPGLFGHDPAPLRREGHLTSKYLAQVFTFALAIASCTPAATAPTPAPNQPTLTPTPSLRPALPVAASVDAARRWYLLPDPLVPSAAALTVTFVADPTATGPTLRLRGTGTGVPLAPTGVANQWSAALDLHGTQPGAHVLEVVERIASGEV